MKTAFTLLLFLFIQIKLISQPEITTNWKIAGMETIDRELQYFDFSRLEQIPEINFLTEYRGNNKGKLDNSIILQQALNNLITPAIIYFPPGIYLFENQIKMPSNVIIRGRSPNTTFFRFDLNDRDQDLFLITGNALPETFEIKEMINEEYSIILKNNDIDFFQAGDEVEFEQENDPELITQDVSWSQWAIGQRAKIREIVGNKIILDRSFTFNYNLNYSIRIKKVNAIWNVGFERFTINRVDKGRASNFNFEYAVNCFVKCIHSKEASRNHIALSRSRNCVVKGSYFEDAIYHCGGGAGYGVMCYQHTSECLIENNIFRKLRHSMIVKEGASRNVYAYNYSIEPTGQAGSISNKEGCVGKKWNNISDITLHGHYPAKNLFEHNIAYWIDVDGVWGPSGPGNTFFRNYVYGKNGITIVGKSHEQNLVGNISDVEFDIKTSAEGVQLYGNYANGKIDNFHNKLPSSLYLDEKPAFFSYKSWPLIGPDTNKRFISAPAKIRLDSEKYFDEHCCGDIPGLNSYVNYIDDFLIFIESGFLYIEYIENIKIDLFISDVSGKFSKEINNVMTNNPIPVGSETLSTGLYIIKVFAEDFTKSFKIIK